MKMLSPSISPAKPKQISPSTPSKTSPKSVSSPHSVLPQDFWKEVGDSLEQPAAYRIDKSPLFPSGLMFCFRFQILESDKFINSHGSN